MFDSSFYIGKSHIVCEDYAQHGTSPWPWLLLSDGCSSSAHTDVGARLLVHSAAQCLQNLQDWSDYHEFADQFIHLAAQTAASLGLEETALDATLLLAIQQGERVKVYVYGDGCIVLKDKQGQVQTLNFDYLHNAPFYPAYRLNAARCQSYLQQAEGARCLRLQASGADSSLHDCQQAQVFEFSLQDYACVGIASDGVSSVLHRLDNELLSLHQVASTLLNFRHTRPGFVQKRLSKALQSWAQAEIYPLDDLSLAVFTADPESAKS